MCAARGTSEDQPSFVTRITRVPEPRCEPCDTETAPHGGTAEKPPENASCPPASARRPSGGRQGAAPPAGQPGGTGPPSAARTAGVPGGAVRGSGCDRPTAPAPLPHLAGPAGGRRRSAAARACGPARAARSPARPAAWRARRGRWRPLGDIGSRWEPLAVPSRPAPREGPRGGRGGLRGRKRRHGLSSGSFYLRCGTPSLEKPK